MFKSFVAKLKKAFKKKAAQNVQVAQVAEKVIEGRLETIEKIAEVLDTSVKKVEKTVKEETKKIEKEVKKATAKKAPSSDKPAPRPKGRPKKAQ